jgi:hypothetical protein
MSRDLYLTGTDPFALFAKMLERAPIDPGHAFYLGYEMAKAAIALTLSKDYRQDEALDWGYLTQPEESHRLRKSRLPLKPAGDTPTTEGSP